MTDLTIDLAQAADADLLLHMARTFHREDGHPLTPDGEAAVRHIIAGEPLAQAWIVRSNGSAAGYLVITLGYSIEYEGRDGLIEDLYLVPEARGRGLGRQVLLFALAQAAQLGIRTLHLEVDTGNAAAHRLYRAAGFEATGRRLMRRRLRQGAVVIG
ncbi:MAG TPA: GNAT family N-acetyltransferase [Acetobacteraceae bacterium]|nr:GNAT family N-acetyltransferase [Acetobacteraceae bacterium]